MCSYKRFCVFLALVLFSTFGITSTKLVKAATSNVTNTADSGPGSLRDAISAAAPGDVINVSATGTVDLASEILINKSLTITGPGARFLAINGQNVSRVFNVNQPTPHDPSSYVSVTISNLTIANGNANFGSDFGGGIYNTANLTLQNVAFIGNVANDGGAIYNGPSDTISGIFPFIDVSNSTFYQNQAVVGGAIANFGQAHLLNSTISGNSILPSDNLPVPPSGGGIFNDAYCSLWYVTIANNASSMGGGIYNDPHGNVFLSASIVANNTAQSAGPDIYGAFDSGDYNLIQNSSGGSLSGNLSNNLIGQSPSLGNLQNNGGQTDTQALLAGSSAIDKIPVVAYPQNTGCYLAGDNYAGLVSDQRDGIRPINGSCDIGAFEHNGPLSPSPTNTATPSNTPSKTSTPTIMPTLTPTSTSSATPSSTPSKTLSPTATPSPSATASPTITPAASSTQNTTLTCGTVQYAHFYAPNSVQTFYLNLAAASNVTVSGQGLQPALLFHFHVVNSNNQEVGYGPHSNTPVAGPMTLPGGAYTVVTASDASSAQKGTGDYQLTVTCNSPTVTPFATNTPLPSSTAMSTTTLTSTSAPTNTPIPTKTPTITPSSTMTVTKTVTVTPTRTPTASATATGTPNTTLTCGTVQYAHFYAPNSVQTFYLNLAAASNVTVSGQGLQPALLFHFHVVNSNNQEVGYGPHSNTPVAGPIALPGGTYTVVTISDASSTQKGTGDYQLTVTCR